MIEPTIELGLMLDLLVWAISLLRQLSDMPISVDPVAAFLGLATLVLTLLAQKRDQKVDLQKKVRHLYRIATMNVTLPHQPGSFG